MTRAHAVAMTAALTTRERETRTKQEQALQIHRVVSLDIRVQFPPAYDYTPLDQRDALDASDVWAVEMTRRNARSGNMTRLSVTTYADAPRDIARIVRELRTEAKTRDDAASRRIASAQDLGL